MDSWWCTREGPDAAQRNMTGSRGHRGRQQHKNTPEQPTNLKVKIGLATHVHAAPAQCVICSFENLCTMHFPARDAVHSPAAAAPDRCCCRHFTAGLWPRLDHFMTMMRMPYTKHAVRRGCQAQAQAPVGLTLDSSLTRRMRGTATSATA